jgi:hypothetical protein
MLQQHSLQHTVNAADRGTHGVITVCLLQDLHFDAVCMNATSTPG